jgi:hypothetical protein
MILSALCLFRVVLFKVFAKKSAPVTLTDTLRITNKSYASPANLLVRVCTKKEIYTEKAIVASDGGLFA